MNSHSLKEEMQRNPELKKSDLEAVKNSIAGRTNLSPLADNDVALFLHRNKYNVEMTKTNIENFFTMRAEMSEYFSKRDPLSTEFLKTVENVSVVGLPKRTPEGYTVILMQLLNSDVNRYDFNDAVKYLNMVVDLLVYEEGTSNGYVYICDIKGATPEHVDRLPAEGLKKFFKYLKHGAHFRWQGMHYVNSSTNDNVINEYVKKKIVDTKLVDNIYLYENVKDMEKVVPLKLLPTEMGGSAGSLQDLHAEQVQKIKNHKEWFKSESRSKGSGIARDMDENDINELNKFCNSGVNAR